MPVETMHVDIAADLRHHGLTDVDDSLLSRAMYSTDASLYRVVPQVVVRPRHIDEVIATIAVARDSGVPVTMRGAGTSIAGNAVGTGIVVDVSKYLNQVHAVDIEARTARIDPGVVHARLQQRLAGTGLRYGPDPSTHSRCTIGGMIGNNACGSRALGYGRAADNVEGLDVVLGTGERLDLMGGRPASATLDRLERVVAGGLGTIRTEFGRFGRQVSGYSLEHLLPENHFDVGKFLAGSEGTLAVFLGATVNLVPEPVFRHCVVLGYPSMADAADAVPTLLKFGPVACEGLGGKIIEVYRQAHGAAAVPEYPAGDGFLYVELTGDDRGALQAEANRVVAAAGALGHRHVVDELEQAILWRIREEGAGLASRVWDRPALSGWEDAAVPPDRLGAYLRDFEDLLAAHDVHGVPYGHFGDGCVHVRIDFPLDAAGGRSIFRDFLGEAATLVASYGGSLSGEHGDGRARSELLPHMYSAAALELFGAVKAVLDPANVLNPGVLVDPAPVDADLRQIGPSIHADLGLRLVHDGGDFGAAVHRCTGVGKCIGGPGAAGVMCPSFAATRDEKDSTRGRARALQEMVDGRLITGGFEDPEVHRALDLCLSCKGCASDCPTGIDMATYKSEVLHQTYRGRVRPRSHYILGRLPQWAKLAAPMARLANASLKVPGLVHLARWSAGVDQRRGLPSFATTRFSRIAHPQSGGADRPKVLLWADSFTEYFSTAGGQAALTLLEAAGYEVLTLARPQCCGLTWITTGQLDKARVLVQQALEQLHPYVAAGIPIVAIEPSCATVLRSDAKELTTDPRADEVAAGVRTLAELLQRTEGYTPPDLTGTRVVVQPHCHQASILGFDADLALLARTGATVTRLSGCCGLAGNFGVERGHYEVSVKIAEQQLLPAVEDSGPDTVFLADGYSCRTQLADLAGVRGMHLAELLTPTAAPTPG
ncbi:MAG: FAD-binding and (Fe-S)-binding domain-containing protein [Mycobacterium sp.]